MLVKKPPMGWNTWNTFGENINDQLIRETAKKIVDTGLKDAGYEYVVIDDCWALRERDENERLVPDPVKFPYGMKDLADYIHSLGLKFGMYSCSGNRTCADYPGSYDHEFIDAETFASWDIDFLKYDFCYRPMLTQGHLLYKRMGAALANCGRDILFSACSWGRENTKDWIKMTGAGMWRSTDDIFDSWDSMKSLALKQYDIQNTNGRGCFNDIDMLVVGMHGKGNVGVTGMTDDEYRFHFSYWCMLASPLMIGCDVRNMDEETEKILKNKKVIAINQDEDYHQPYDLNHEMEAPIWVRLLENGDYAIGMFNLSEEKKNMNFSLVDLGLDRICGRQLEAEDLWTGETFKIRTNYHEEIAPHGFRLMRAKVISI